MASSTSTDRFTEYAVANGVSRKEAKRQLGAKRRKGDYTQASAKPATMPVAAPPAMPAAAPASVG